MAQPYNFFYKTFFFQFFSRFFEIFIWSHAKFKSFIAFKTLALHCSIIVYNKIIPKQNRPYFSSISKISLKDNIHSTIKLFTDDSILYREIIDPNNHTILQDDLDTLAEWSVQWLMCFNVKKCVVLSRTRKKKSNVISI